jgi:hypothetical protein
VGEKMARRIDEVFMHIDEHQAEPTVLEETHIVTENDENRSIDYIIEPNDENLIDALREFHTEIRDHVEPIDADEQQAYLEGIVYGLAFQRRHVPTVSVTPIGREMFIFSAKSKIENMADNIRYSKSLSDGYSRGKIYKMIDDSLINRIDKDDHFGSTSQFALQATRKLDGHVDFNVVSALVDPYLTILEMDINDFTKEFSEVEKLRFYEGIYHGLNAETRLAGPVNLTPFQREEFIQYSIEFAYRKAEVIKGVDQNRFIGTIFSTTFPSLEEAYSDAAIVHEVMGIPKTRSQELDLDYLHQILKE